MDNIIEIIINDKPYKVKSDLTIMEACDSVGIEIPRLCFLKNINENACCRICLVEIKGFRTLKNSCTIKITPGMEIKTNTLRVINAIKTNLKLLAINHRFECYRCIREHNCEFLRLLRKYDIEVDNNVLSLYKQKKRLENNTNSIELDTSKCILCGRCVASCKYFTNLNILNYNYRGFKTYVSTALNMNFNDSGCIYCGKCVQMCPTAALKEHSDINECMSLINNKDYYVVCEVAPSIRVSLGEEFGYPIGTNVEGKMYNAIKHLGFKDIVDTNFAADVTIMEEGYEFLERLKENKNLPMFTSCCPSWIRYVERYYPSYLPNISTTKSPQQIEGALIKSYYATLLKLDREKIKVVAIMPCIAKKDEAKRKEMKVDSLKDVDLVLTTRELARMIKIHDIDFLSLDNYKPITPLAEYSGAGAIFGVTGGVMEAAIRTIYNLIEKKQLTNLEIMPLRGNKEIKEASIMLAGRKINLCVVSGAKNIPILMEMLKNGTKKYDFIEVMSCIGGCVNGGGQPVVQSYIYDKFDVKSLRGSSLYNIDLNKKCRMSHENVEVKRLYKEFLKYPNSELSHYLLHTAYSKKDKF